MSSAPLYPCGSVIVSQGEKEEGDRQRKIFMRQCTSHPPRSPPVTFLRPRQRAGWDILPSRQTPLCLSVTKKDEGKRVFLSWVLAGSKHPHFCHLWPG